MSHCYIYLITESPVKDEVLKGDKYFKMGYSKRPKSRLSSIQCGNPVPLIIARTFLVEDECFAKEKEKEFMAKFRRFKKGCKGEWFRGDIKKAISLFDRLSGFQNDPQFQLNKELRGVWDRKIQKTIDDNKIKEECESKEKARKRQKARKRRKRKKENNRKKSPKSSAPLTKAESSFERKSKRKLSAYQRNLDRKLKNGKTRFEESLPIPKVKYFKEENGFGEIY